MICPLSSGEVFSALDKLRSYAKEVVRSTVMHSQVMTAINEIQVGGGEWGRDVTGADEHCLKRSVLCYVDPCKIPGGLGHPGIFHCPGNHGIKT